MADSQLMQQFKQFLFKMIDLGGSDLHLKAGGTIRARIRGDIQPLANIQITKEIALGLCRELFPERFQEFLKTKEMDFNFKLNEKFRFRGNAFFQMEGPALVMRVIPVEILSLKQLKMPDILYKISNTERGLVLVTGVTGSGKSTTLAAMINEVNSTRSKHIITVEDPIEFVHKEKNVL